MVERIFFIVQNSVLCMARILKRTKAKLGTGSQGMQLGNFGQMVMHVKDFSLRFKDSWVVIVSIIIKGLHAEH